jgi:hypothetical protein
MEKQLQAETLRMLSSISFFEEIEICLIEPARTG